MFHSTLDTSRSPGLLTLTGDLTIRNAMEFKETLSNAMHQIPHQQLALNLEEVERIDLSTLQILCAAHRSLLKQGKTLTITGSLSNTFRETVHHAGFAECAGNKETSGLWMGVNN